MVEVKKSMSPLSDLRVLGVTVYLAGPFAMMNLARLGAECIKVEMPGVGDPSRGNGPFASPDGYVETRSLKSIFLLGFLKGPRV